MKHQLIINRLRGFADLERFYIEFNHCLYNTGIDELELDLSSVLFMTPESVLALVCVIRSWYINRRTPVRLISMNEQVYQYLQRVDLFSQCANYVMSDNTSSKLWHRSMSSTLLEITSIPSEPETNAQAVYTVFQKASSLLLGRVANSHMKAICDLLTIVVENITHSQDIGHVMMQSYQVADDYRVHIGIVDLGLGIPTTLKPRYPEFSGGSLYLLKALEMGVTSRLGLGGLGLFNADRIIRGQQGSLTIRANGSMLQVLRNKIYLRDNLVFFPGTQVYISIWGNHDTSTWEYLLPEYLT